jgi:hypothetical protein
MKERRTTRWATGGGGLPGGRIPRQSDANRPEARGFSIYDFLIEKYENKDPSKTLMNIASQPVLIEKK